MIPREMEQYGHRPSSKVRQPQRREGYVPVARRKHKRTSEAALILDPGSEYTAAEVEFMMAMDRYKRDRHRPYPDCRDILQVVRQLGYRKESEPTNGTP